LEGVIFLLVYIIEEEPRIFSLIKKMTETSGKYIFLYGNGNAEFSGDMQEYINSQSNEVYVFNTATSEDINYYHGHDHGNKAGIKADLMVLGDAKQSINADVNLSEVNTFLVNIENIDKFKNINFGGSQVITCGLREKDTVIFSSIDADEGSVMLDLQRSITNIKNESTEPFEKKILIESCLTGNNSEDILFALTVLIYCGKLK